MGKVEENLKQVGVNIRIWGGMQKKEEISGHAEEIEVKRIG